MLAYGRMVVHFTSYNAENSVVCMRNIQTMI